MTNRQRPPSSEELEDRVLAYKKDQDLHRGAWPSPREVDIPFPPWPPRDSAMIGYLVREAMLSLGRGNKTPKQILTHLAVHAWFEGGIANYDRGRHDAEDARDRRR